MLSIQGATFELEQNTRDSAFYISGSEDSTLNISLEVTCKSGTVLLYGEEGREPLEERVMPSLTINDHTTRAKTPRELAGQSFKVDSIDEADEREDTFYLFEHEPFVAYRLEVLAVEDNKAHIHCEGVAVTDGYADPYCTDAFKLDCWLPIITGPEDWKQFGL